MKNSLLIFRQIRTRCLEKISALLQQQDHHENLQEIQSTSKYRTEWTFITIVGVVIIFFNYWRRPTYWYGPSYARARIVADARMAYNSVLVFRRFSGISAIRPCRRACHNAASWSEIVSVTRPVNTRRSGTPRPANGSRENRRYDHLPQRADAHGYDGAARQRTSIIRLRV